MAAFSLDIADSDLSRVTAALCAPINVGFNLPGAESIDANTARQRAIQFLIAVTQQYEIDQASKAFVPPIIT
jgi:hypothetical protein